MNASPPPVNAPRPPDPHTLRLLELKLRIAESTYDVDPTLVAAALLRRGGLRLFASPTPLNPDDARIPPGGEDRARRVS